MGDRNGFVPTHHSLPQGRMGNSRRNCQWHTRVTFASWSHVPCPHQQDAFFQACIESDRKAKFLLLRPCQLCASLLLQSVNQRSSAQQDHLGNDEATLCRENIWLGNQKDSLGSGHNGATNSSVFSDMGISEPSVFILSKGNMLTSKFTN